VTGQVGSEVWIQGNGFGLLTSVKVGSISVTVASGDAGKTSATAAWVIIPSGVGSSTVNVVMVTSDTQSTPGSAAQFTASAPSLSSVTLSTVQPGGTFTDIKGAALTDATQVCVGSTCVSTKGSGTAANTFSVIDAADIEMTLPAGTPAEGSYTLTVTTSEGTTNGEAVSVYHDTSVPTITSLSVSSGPEQTMVTLTGTGFADMLGGKLGSAAITSGNWLATSDTSAWIIIPSGIGTSGNPYNVTVQNDIGWSTSAAPFTVTAAAVTSISPSTVNAISGGGEGNAFLTVTGTGFYDATQLCFGSTCLTSGGGAGQFSMILVTQITVPTSLPSGIPDGTLAVTVVSPEGTSNATVTLTVTTIPAVISVSPSSGVVGTTPVVISGTLMSGATEVSVGSVDVSVCSSGCNAWVNGSQVDVTIPSGVGSGTVDIRVENSRGWSAVASADHFTMSVPTITSVASSPIGPGGTFTDIQGTGFADVSSVCLGTTCMTSGSGAAPGTFSVLPSGVDIEATLPAGVPSEGSYSLTVVSTEGTSSGYSITVYVDPKPPTIIGMSTTGATGPWSTTGLTVAVGQEVYLEGSGFTELNGVTVGTTVVTSGNYGDSTSDGAAWLMVPTSLGVGQDYVIASNKAGSSTGSAASQVTVGGALVTSVSPSTVNPGGTFTIYGTGFTGVTGVSLGSTALTAGNGTTAGTYSVVSNGAINAAVPYSMAGSEAVKVITSDGTSNTSVNLTISAIPVITGINLTSAYPDESIVISGYNMSNVSSVTFGADGAGSVTGTTATSVTVTTPNHQTGGAVSVTMSNGSGGSEVAAGDSNSFTFYAVADFTSFSPTSGYHDDEITFSYTGSGTGTLNQFVFGSSVGTGGIGSGGSGTYTVPAPWDGANPGAVTVYAQWVDGSAIANVPIGTFTYDVETAPTISSITDEGNGWVQANGTMMADITSGTVDGSGATISVTGSNTSVAIDIPAADEATSTGITFTNAVGQSGTYSWTYGQATVFDSGSSSGSGASQHAVGGVDGVCLANSSEPWWGYKTGPDTGSWTYAFGQTYGTGLCAEGGADGDTYAYYTPGSTGESVEQDINMTTVAGDKYVATFGINNAGTAGQDSVAMFFGTSQGASNIGSGSNNATGDGGTWTVYSISAQPGSAATWVRLQIYTNTSGDRYDITDVTLTQWGP
jgi:hypothetical protein